jgi:predicted CoA-binding protein
MAELTTDHEIAAVLRAARTIAVLGAHDQPVKPAFYVPDYLHGQGYRIVPVNPMLAGRTLWGEPVRSSLAEIHEPIDVVDVFRRPDLLMDHLDDLRAMKPRPGLLWLQLGIRNDAFARAVAEAGIDVVQDRCTLADHRRLRIGPVKAA